MEIWIAAHRGRLRWRPTAWRTMIGRIQIAVGLGSLVFGAVYTWQIAVNAGLLGTLLQ